MFSNRAFGEFAKDGKFEHVILAGFDEHEDPNGENSQLENINRSTVKEQEGHRHVMEHRAQHHVYDEPRDK